MRIEQMTVHLNDEKQLIARDGAEELIAQRGAAALWCLAEDEPRQTGTSGGGHAADDTCFMHAWTCIWCSMTPPICGSCRPVTPPCPGTGLVHVCACSSELHRREAA